MEIASDEDPNIGSSCIASAGAANINNIVKELARHKHINGFSRFIVFLSFHGIVLFWTERKISTTT